MGVLYALPDVCVPGVAPDQDVSAGGEVAVLGDPEPSGSMGLSVYT